MPQTQSNSTELNFSELTKFFPKQKTALDATKKWKYVLYGGSVGSGKSYWLRWTTVYWLMYYFAKYRIEGVRAGIFCETYQALHDRHLTKVRFEFPEWLGSWNEQKKEFTLAKKWGSGIISFRNTDEPEKYLSVEFAVIAIDEINRNPKTTFDMLRSRHRWPGIPDVKFFAACNPLGEAWVKNMWVKRLFSPEEKEQYEFVFVPALPTDNPHLPESYYKGLESLPEAQRKAYLEGNWDAFDEGMDEKGYRRLVTDRELQGAIVQSGNHSGYKILGVDPAAGGDNSAIVLKSGNLQEILFNQKLQNTMDLVGVVMDLYRQHAAAQIIVDNTGVGRGVYDRLRETDYPVKAIDFGSKPTDETMFKDKKAELYWAEREWILKGGRLLFNYGWNEFEIVKYKHQDKDRTIRIQPKEELFREGILSPNCVDAAVLTMAITDTSIKNTRKLQAGYEFHDATLDIWRN